MPRPKKQKTEWPSPYALPQEQSASSPTVSSVEEADMCSNCIHSMTLSSDIWVRCDLKLPNFYKQEGPPVMHRAQNCSFHKRKE